MQGFTISGISGSAAEKYAADNGFTFISLGAPAPVTYTVTFTDWDGTVLRAQTVEKGQPAIAPSVPVRAGYTFLSWSGTFDNVTADVTVTAQYTKIDTFVVTFKDWNGEILKTEVIEVGESAIAPSAPKRTGYTFSGWDKSFTGVTSNLTITAQYKKDEDPASAPSSWAAADIAKAKELKLSTTELEANYQANTTRAEFCRLAVNFVEIYYGKSISEVLANKKLTLGKFSDTNDSAILAANALGIVAGIGDGSFNPKGTLTREQAAVMLTMTLEAIGIDTSADADANFADNSATASWAQNSVNSVFSRGIMAGTGNNNFAAKESYTHEQSIATILRLYNNTK
ncbi:MAG: InlB B-repeat-containing protein [Oscillospiraceae bacterium]|nr:InlB B-repeat-containing protein [Oscillospiraceae bacterium]